MTALGDLTQGAARLGTSAAEHLWQATLFAGLVMLLAWTLRGAPARLRYNLYLLAPLKFLIPSALLLLVFRRFGGDLGSWIPRDLAPFFDPQGAMAAGMRWLGLSLPGLPVAGSGAGAGASPLWLLALLVWGGGAALLAFGWGRRLQALDGHLRQEAVRASGPAAERLEVQRHRLGLKKAVSLRISPEVAQPGVWGVRNPTVVLPASMAENLEADELDAVLLHELVHVERRDNLVSHALMVLRCLVWFHPLVWWLDRRLLAERERACDERVVEVTGRPDAYLRGLAKVLRLGLGARPVGVSLASGSDLQRRIRRLRSQAPPAASPFHRGILAVAFGLLAFFSVAASSLGAAGSCSEAKVPLQVRTAQELLQETSGGDEVALGRLPERPPWPSRAACPKKRLQAAPENPSDCDDLRRM